MFCEQIAVFLKNENGRMSEFCKALADANVNVNSLVVAETDEYGILRVITDDNDRALEVLRAAGYVAKPNRLIAVSVDDVPGSLQKVLAVLEAESISVNYLYSYTQPDGKTLVLLKVDDCDGTAEVLKRAGYLL